MADPVAWNMIERGWTVVDAAQEELGHVDEVLGDENADIFDGLTISHGLLAKPQYVASENVAQIVEGEVQLSVTRAAVEALQQD
jgi:hypothetical protein